jgi:hypothetical protein
MNNTAYVDWIALLLLLAGLGCVAYQFSRRTYRITVLLAAMAGVAALTEFGVTISDATGFVNVFKAGSLNVIETMLSPLVPGTEAFKPGIIGWAVLLVLCAGVLIWFDTWSARREEPRVIISEAPKAEADNTGLDDRRDITEELRFRLPAVYVRKPASMPGGSTLDNLASMVSESDVKGGKVTAALMRLVHDLEGQPRTYEARVFVERCSQDGRWRKDGNWMRVTVDLQDARTGQSVAVRMLPACLPEEAAEKVAGFAARQVFRDDPSTPGWAVGSSDGDHLSAYLLAQEICVTGPTFEELWRSRQQRRAKLHEAVRNSPAPGLVGYELAAMDDMDGDYLNALLLHLRNRIQYPRFWAGRYRLAISLSSLAWLIFDKQWQSGGNSTDGTAQRDLGHVWEEIARLLDQSGLIRGLSKEGAEGRASAVWSHDPYMVSRALLYVAKDEHDACRHSAGTARILWGALCHREMRASLLQMLHGKRWRHPRRRRLVSSIAIDIAEQRLNLLERPNDAGSRLDKAQKKAWKLVHEEEPAKRTRKVPWQAVYNAACLYALSSPRGRPEHDKVLKAIELLRRAINDPDCDLEHPCEWIAMDPDLRPLRKDPEFRKFVIELAARDFAPGAPAQAGDEWFRGCLKTICTNGPAVMPASGVSVTAVRQWGLGWGDTITSHTGPGPQQSRMEER